LGRRRDEDQPQQGQGKVIRLIRVLTNHIAFVESHVLTPLLGTATEELSPSVIIAIAIRLTTGRTPLPLSFWIDILQFPAPDIARVMASAYYEFYRGSSYVVLVHLSPCCCRRRRGGLVSGWPSPTPLMNSSPVVRSLHSLL